MNLYDPTVAANSNYPHIGPTATKVPEIRSQQPTEPGARTFVYVTPQYIYVVQPEDTIASVAKKLFGVNSKHYRDYLRRNGFRTGQPILHTNGEIGNSNG